MANKGAILDREDETGFSLPAGLAELGDYIVDDQTGIGFTRRGGHTDHEHPTGPLISSSPRWRVWGVRYSPVIERGGTREPATGGPILVVEDDPEILSTVADILEFEGYEVECATNGAEALKILERVRPGLVLLDMRMPVLNGWEFARIVNERGIKLPILVMTAAQNARRWAEEIGAAGYVSKPFDIPDLIDAIERLKRES